MKKVFSILIACVFLIGFVGNVFAADLTDLEASPQRGKIMSERVEKKPLRFEALKEFKDEMHKINSLRMEKNLLANQVIEKNDKIIDLYIAAREADNQEALEEAKEVRQQIRDLNKEKRELEKSIRETRKVFREEVKNDNFTAAEDYLNNIIDSMIMINGKIEAKIACLSDIIDILS